MRLLAYLGLAWLALLLQTVEVEPAVDFPHLEEVLVLLREAL